MRRKRPATLFGTATFLAIMAAGAVLYSCTRPTTTDGSTNPTPPATPSETILPTPSPGTSSSTRTITVYKVVANSESGTKLEKVEIPSPEGKTEPGDIAVAALNYMAEQKDSPLPRDAKAVSVKFDGELATVDFNKAFETNFPGGDQKEALLFNAVTATLGQFPDVKKVQIVVDGKKVALGGTQDTTEPLGVPSFGENSESNSSNGQ